MSAIAALSPALRARISAVARRVRLLRAARGLGWLVLLLATMTVATLAADYFLELPVFLRQTAFATWLGLGLSVLFLGTLLPLFRRIDSAALAAVIEERYPDLGERLTSAVELSDHADAGNGSPEIIDFLIRDTEERVGRINFLPAVSGRSAVLVGGAAILALGLALVPAAIWPREIARLGQRFFRPWYTPPVLPPYALSVAPGDLFAARGRALTIHAKLVPDDDTVVLPTSCTLVRVDGAGMETHQRMIADQSDAFSTTLNVEEDFHYYVQAELVASEAFAVTAITPVGLAAESPTVTVTPPQYAQATLDPQTLHGLVDLTALKHSTIRFDLRFTRPAISATLQWMAADGDPGKTINNRLTLADNNQSAQFTFPALVLGSYRLTLAAEHGLLTELDGGALTVTPDRPPAFLKAPGKPALQAVLPYDRLPLEMTVADDIGVARADLEYRVNGGKPALEPIQLAGVNTREAVGKHLFQLGGKVKEGDEVHYRLRCQDNLPSQFGGPHTVYHPADRWLSLKVVKQAKPIKEQEILAQRDNVKRRLESIKADLLKEQRGVYRLRQESRKSESLNREQADDLKQLQRENQASERALRELAREMSDNAALEPITQRVQEVADQEMHQSDKALREASQQKKAEDRGRKFENADKQLTSALKKIDELGRANERLAQDRLDQARVEMLAERQQNLAEKAAELARRDPVRDPASKEQLGQVKRDQAEVAADLDKMTQQSESLRRALEAARTQQARQLSERARDLAQQERDLARASRETEQQRAIQRLDELAKRQQKLADKARELAKTTRAPTEMARAKPLKADDAERAAAALRLGNADDAVKLQDSSAKELDRLATDIDKAMDLARDPKEAAQQLARLQDAVQKRLQEELGKRDQKPLTERIEPIKREQKAIKEAAQQLSVPPQNAAVQQARKEATERAQAASEQMASSPKNALRSEMPRAQEALDRLAKALPTIQQRQQEAQRQVAQLRRQQDEVGRLAEQAQQQAAKANPKDAKAIEQAGKQLADAARKQAEVAEALGKMDAPNLESRKARTEMAANEALRDLMDARREDIAASQADVRRQLERLEQALAGKKPADEQARDLAQRQKELTQDAARAAADKVPPGKMLDLQRKQQQIAEETKNLAAPDAAKRKAEAVSAAQQAANTPPAAPEARERMATAARKLDELARQLEGRETAAQEMAREPAKQQQDTGNQQSTSSPPEHARQLARQQRELAQATQRAEQTAAKQPGQPAARKELEKDLDALARLQRNLNKEAARLPATQAQKGLEQARSAMNQAEQALARKDAPQARQKQSEAAEALDRLAKQLPAQAQKSQPNQEAASRPQGLPNPAQAEQARQLAKEQREIRDAVQRAAETARAENAPRANPASELAREQAAIAKQANELARNVAKEMGRQSASTRQAEQAKQSAEQAARQLQAGALPQAKQAGQQSALDLRQLARQVAETPRSANADPHAADPVQQARKLADRQEQVNRQLMPLANNTDAQRGAQQAGQQSLAQQTGQLAQDLGKLAQALARTPQSGQPARQAASSSQQAQAAMQQAQVRARQGNQGQAQQSQNQAATALDRAAQQAAQAAQAAMPASRGQAASQQRNPAQDGARASVAPTQDAGQSVEHAQGQIAQAQDRLNRDQARSAQAAMANAAQALQQAAQQLAQAQNRDSQPGGQQQNQPGQQAQAAGTPAAIGNPGAGRPDASMFGPDARKYAGKTWGELPGELRTKIVQDMKVRYGDDYARMIKLYFEQIAETKRK